MSRASPYEVVWALSPNIVVSANFVKDKKPELVLALRGPYSARPR